jgi:hypothetical protein
MARYLSIEEKLALLRRIEAGERLAAVADETGGCASRFANAGQLFGRTGRHYGGNSGVAEAGDELRNFVVRGSSPNPRGLNRFAPR